jgi:hypothetical protein
MQLENKIIVQGKLVSYQHPADPFTYLGVDLTLTLNWGHQLRKVLSRQTCQQGCCATALQRGCKAEDENNTNSDQANDNVCLPSSPIPGHGHQKTGQQDSSDGQGSIPAVQGHPHSHHLSWRTSPAALGWPTTSLLVDYAHACIKHVTYAINDKGTYGYVTRSLINAQASATDRQPT